MIRPAVITDASAIQKLVNAYASKGEMLLLSKNEVYERIYAYFIYEDEGRIKGVCALQPMWEDAAEIRSLAVAADVAKNGIGRKLVKAQLERAKNMGFQKVFALTYVPGFFEKLGFTLTSIDLLPKKVWTDCLKCVKYPDCDETAMIKDI